jgi:hypothetical protein
MSFFFFFFFSLLYHTPLTSKRYKGYDNGTKDKGKGNNNMMVSGACLVLVAVPLLWCLEGLP